jgi:hypothetical protein
MSARGWLGAATLVAAAAFAQAPGAPHAQERQEMTSLRVNDQTWVVSYLAESGHTLTVVLNLANHQATGFASNDKTWHQLSGTFEVMNVQPDGALID